MSSNFKCDQTLCRNTYYNYGSYLRSRGYDKEICNLIMELQNGHIPINALKVDTNTGILQINGSVQINGNLTVTGDTVLEGQHTKCKNLIVHNQLFNSRDPVRWARNCRYCRRRRVQEKFRKV